MALEYAAMKVRVNAIAPSATLTERVKKLISQNPALEKTGCQSPAGAGPANPHRRHGSLSGLRRGRHHDGANIIR
jgi:NAD(P)-dependent dehydrogenase (short-subunit alcohol dehydrogenase family)